MDWQERIGQNTLDQSWVEARFRVTEEGGGDINLSVDGNEREGMLQ